MVQALLKPKGFLSSLFRGMSGLCFRQMLESSLQMQQSDVTKTSLLKQVPDFLKQPKPVGAALMPNTTVSEIDRSSHPIKIRTSLGAQFHATKVVISSGAWTNKSLGIAGKRSCLSSSNKM
jgi:thioredoxin reductase